MNHAVGRWHINVDDVDDSPEAVFDADGLTIDDDGPCLARQGLHVLAVEAHHFSGRDVARHHVVEQHVSQQFGLGDQAIDQIVQRDAQCGRSFLKGRVGGCEYGERPRACESLVESGSGEQLGEHREAAGGDGDINDIAGGLSACGC